VSEVAGTTGTAGVVRGFRDGEAAGRLIAAIHRLIERLGRPVTLMEVCGTHTMAISRTGIRDLLRGAVDLRSGPGCPVCVTSESDLDCMVALSHIPGVTVLTYGDMLRVPGSFGSLERARAEGADVRVVYSALDAVQAAAAEPDRTFVFLGVGFETTAPGAALAVLRAAGEGLGNFAVLSAHKTLPEALRALLGAPRSGARPGTEGFILPGHVSAVIGHRAYDFLAQEYGLPGAVTGFEPVDILLAVRRLVGILAGAEAGGESAPRRTAVGGEAGRASRRQAAGAGAASVLNLYPRVVKEDGNPRARAIIDRVFEPGPAEWRGLGTVPGSGLVFRDAYREFDAARRFAGGIAEALEALRRREDGWEKRVALRRSCRCGDVLRGDMVPPECGLFGRACTPSDPVGPCMVSSEGSCAAYYRYERARGRGRPTERGGQA